MTKAENVMQRVHQEIMEHEGISILELARTMGVQADSLRNILRPLIKQRYLYHRRGEERVSFHPEFGRVVGIDLGGSHVHFALADCRGKVLRDSNLKIRPEDGPEALIAQIVKGARAIAARSGARLRAAAMGVPSPVDAERGVVTFAYNLPGWKDIYLRRELEQKLRVPVMLENDCNLAAVGEHWQGVAKGVDNFVMIAIGTGTGSGVFVDGKLHRGRLGAAGEVYHMNLDWQRWADDFGDSGHFESVVSGIGIATQGHKVLPPGEGAAPSDLAAERDAYFVFEAFRQGNSQARAVLEKTFIMLGVAIANIIAILDPDLIVLGGGIAKGAPDFMLETTGKVVQHLYKESAPPIKLTALDDKAQTFGAISAALTLTRQAIARRLETWIPQAGEKVWF